MTTTTTATTAAAAAIADVDSDMRARVAACLNAAPDNALNGSRSAAKTRLAWLNSKAVTKKAEMHELVRELRARQHAGERGDALVALRREIDARNAWLRRAQPEMHRLIAVMRHGYHA